MKNKIYLLLMFLVTITSCEKKEYEVYNVASPEFMTKEAFRSSVQITPAQEIVESGKVYVYRDLILISDKKKGIHIIDNSNPLFPRKKVFIKIIGNTDMEVKNNYLYANSLMDLLVFDISDLNTITQVSRLKDVFPNYIVLPRLENLVYNYESYDYSSDKVLVNWNIKQEYREVEESPGVFTDFDVALANDVLESVGQGGSLARFKIVESYLYAVDSNNITIFDISDLDSPIEKNDVFVGFGIETIFNRGEYLFLGSTTGMFIYNISSPDIPQFVSEFTHATACDPVIVDGDYAYVTLRGGNSCGTFESSLEVINISEVETPLLVKRYPLNSPYGLGIRNDLLFICDGTSGLKVYNKEKVEDLQLLQTISNITAYDVIPLENRLVMIGGNELYQYTYSSQGINLISSYSLGF